ncbi:thiolase family protein (plasmid) [Halorussus vallis]|nr:thiolase family protein [Halorussus vallis]USZ78422.1 thiolase family protein [Halorussus vallis]
MTRFRSAADESVGELLETAAERALDDAGVSPAALTSLHVGNAGAEAFNRRSGLQNALAASLGAEAAAADRIENTSASGASAFRRAVQAVESGVSELALVVGAEKMSAASTAAATDVISRIVHEAEYAQGVTLPSYGGLAADAYLRRYDADRAALAQVAVKNHANATENPYAQFRREITVEDVLDSPKVAEPLRLYDCCPTSDGAAAVLLAAEESHPGSDAGIRVAGCESAVGTHAVGERSDPLEIAAVRRAGEGALAAAGQTPDDVDVACIHDAFSILELLELEELGFYDAGEAWRATLDGETALDGPLPVNPGGGLKARGHPLGATGVSQVVELVWQLRGEASGRQVADAEVGLALNVAGFGNNGVCSVLEAR